MQLSLFPDDPVRYPVQELDLALLEEEHIVYPESDGKPMAENTEHFDLLIMIKSALDVLFEDDPEVFVAGDLLWYPVKGKPYITMAPDVLVALGRPKGRRGSYIQHLEENIPPQVLFEILSPSNRSKDMARKYHFYAKYGVLEYFVYDTEYKEISLHIRVGEYLVPALPFVKDSALLGIRLAVIEEELRLIYPDGKIAPTYTEQYKTAKTALEQLEAERKAKEEERKAKEDALAELARLRAKLDKNEDRPNDEKNKED